MTRPDVGGGTETTDRAVRRLIDRGYLYAASSLAGGKRQRTFIRRSDDAFFTATIWGTDQVTRLDFRCNAPARTMASVQISSEVLSLLRSDMLALVAEPQVDLRLQEQTRCELVDADLSWRVGQTACANGWRVWQVQYLPHRLASDENLLGTITVDALGGTMDPELYLRTVRGAVEHGPGRLQLALWREHIGRREIPGLRLENRILIRNLCFEIEGRSHRDVRILLETVRFLNPADRGAARRCVRNSQPQKGLFFRFELNVSDAGCFKLKGVALAREGGRLRHHRFLNMVVQ